MVQKIRLVRRSSWWKSADEVFSEVSTVFNLGLKISRLLCIDSAVQRREGCRETNRSFKSGVSCEATDIESLSRQRVLTCMVLQNVLNAAGGMCPTKEFTSICHRNVWKCAQSSVRKWTTLLRCLRYLDTRVSL